MDNMPYLLTVTGWSEVYMNYFTHTCILHVRSYNLVDVGCPHPLDFVDTERLLIPLDLQTLISVDVVDKNTPDPLHVPPTSLTALFTSFSIADVKSHI